MGIIIGVLCMCYKDHGPCNTCLGRSLLGSEMELENEKGLVVVEIGSFLKHRSI